MFVVHPFCRYLRAAVLLALLALFACGGGGHNIGNDMCQCTPSAPVSEDFRHAEKHVPLPPGPAVVITVGQILQWPAGPDPADNAPRTGKELTLYHIASAYLQNARLNSFDCDIHFEVSDVPDRNAPRVIVETPSDSEYCSSRQAVQSSLSQHGFQLQPIDEAHVGEADLPQALPVSILGLAFRDFEHNRGTARVESPWELHPAGVTLLQ